MSLSVAKQIASTTLSTPADTYIYSLAQFQESCAAISSDDSLRFFSPASLSVTQCVTKAHKGITCLHAVGHGRGVLTAGRDGLVRSWDERCEAATTTLEDPRAAGFTALAASEHLIAAGTESTKEGLGDVSVLIWDTRNTIQPLRQYTESHTDTITQLSFHSTQPSTLLSAATDGLVSIFDTSIADEDDALAQVLNHSAAVHCAGFLDADEIYAVSSDEQFSIYTLSKPSDPEDAPLPVTAFGDVRGVLSCSYVIDVLLPRGSPSPWIAVGDTSSTSLSLVPLQPSWTFDNKAAMLLPGAHGEEIVRDVLLDSQHHRILTCGEDGQVRLWATKEPPQSDGGEPMEISNADEGKKKRRKKGKGDKERYNPY